MRVVVVLQPNIFSHVPLMVCCSLMCWCRECGSVQPIIGGWTELWVFQKSNVQFAKVVKANVQAMTKTGQHMCCTNQPSVVPSLVLIDTFSAST